MSIIWRLLKYLFFLSLTLIAIGLMWWIVATLHGDDKLDPEYETFFQNKIDYTTDNGAVAMLGLSAPADVQDSYAWALSIAQKGEQMQKAEIEDLKKKSRVEAMGDPKFWANVSEGVFNSQAYDVAANKLVFQGDTKTIHCWLFRGWVIGTEGTPLSTTCDKQAVLDLIGKNQLLLARYTNALTHRRYVELINLTGMTGQTLIQAQETYMAALVLMSSVDTNRALIEWMNNVEFYKYALTGQTSLIARSVLMVNYKIAQEVLPAMLEGKDVAHLPHANMLMSILSPYGARDVNIMNTVKAEYALLSPFYAALDNYNKNKVLQFYKDFAAMWNTPASQSNKRDEFRKQYVIYDQAAQIGNIYKLTDWRSPILGIVTNLVIGGMAVGGDLANAMDMADARSRMLNLYVQMKALNIRPEQVAEFLRLSPPQLYNPFYLKPFQYDASKHMIYYQGPGGITQGLLVQ